MLNSIESNILRSLHYLPREGVEADTHHYNHEVVLSHGQRLQVSEEVLVKIPFFKSLLKRRNAEDFSVINSQGEFTVDVPIHSLQAVLHYINHDCQVQHLLRYLHRESNILSLFSTLDILGITLQVPDIETLSVYIHDTSHRDRARNYAVILCYGLYIGAFSPDLDLVKTDSIIIYILSHSDIFYSKIRYHIWQWKKNDFEMSPKQLSLFSRLIERGLQNDDVETDSDSDCTD